MKKRKLKKLVKSAQRTVKNNIKSSLVKELNSLTSGPGQGSKKLVKEIEKGAKRLAKKLSKEIKIDKSTLIEKEVEVKTLNAAKTTKSTTAESKVTIPKKAATSIEQGAKLKNPSVALVKTEVAEEKS